VFRQARAKLLGPGRVAEDLDEAQDGRTPPEQAEAFALAVACRIWLVPEIGMLVSGEISS
jgi:hypothetical protein